MRLASSLLALVPLGLALLVGCGGSATETSAHGGGGAAADSGSGGGSTGDGGAASAKGGFVIVTSETTEIEPGAPQSSFYVSAYFDDWSNDKDSCTSETDGVCTLFLCPEQQKNPSLLTAGTLTIPSPRASTTLDPSVRDDSYTTLEHEALWSPGDTVKVKASGGSVPAFAMSVAAPTFVRTTSPPAKQQVVLPGAADLSVTWSGATPGKVHLLLVSADSGQTRYGSIDCVVDAAAGQGSIPASLAAKLPRSTDGTLSVEVQSEARDDFDGFTVWLLATTPGIQNGAEALWSVDLE